MMLKTIVAMQKCIHCIYVDKRVQLLEHRTELYNYGKKIYGTRTTVLYNVLREIYTSSWMIWGMAGRQLSCSWQHA